MQQYRGYIIAVPVYFVRFPLTCQCQYDFVCAKRLVLYTCTRVSLLSRKIFSDFFFSFFNFIADRDHLTRYPTINTFMKDKTEMFELRVNAALRTLFLFDILLQRANCTLVVKIRFVLCQRNPT